MLEILDLRDGSLTSAAAGIDSEGFLVWSYGGDYVAVVGENLVIVHRVIGDEITQVWSANLGQEVSAVAWATNDTLLMVGDGYIEVRAGENGRQTFGQHVPDSGEGIYVVRWRNEKSIEVVSVDYGARTGVVAVIDIVTGAIQIEESGIEKYVLQLDRSVELAGRVAVYSGLQIGTSPTEVYVRDSQDGTIISRSGDTWPREIELVITSGERTVTSPVTTSELGLSPSPRSVGEWIAAAALR